MITLQMEEDDVLSLLTDRVEYWTNDQVVIGLFQDMYENLVYGGAFEGGTFDVWAIVDNDYVNYCDVIYPDDERYDECLEAHNAGESEADGFYIEAVNDAGDEPVFLIRAY